MKLMTLTTASLIALTAALPALAQTTTAKAGTELTVRGEPSPFGSVMGVLAVDQEVTIEGCLEDVSWCQISSGEMTGWASGQYLYVSEGADAVTLIDMAGNPEALTIITQTPAEGTVADDTVTQGDQNAAALTTGTLGALTAVALGGPVGAIVAAGVAGTAVGAAAVEPTEETLTFVTTNPVETVYLDGEVVVGAVVPAEVTTYEVPQAEYRYLNVNGLPVLVNAADSTIVRVIR
ncbi:SH3 domain-containing protein [Loktanella fryxellensis]|uniref:SH3 domain-containing protein n=1 Tax=Loktanella fryxellensis TaxID=245187 RepID=A0A1H8AG99_9RHOB|nr:DUF1236 domain-containing protein [Loktanella fryxellensis]SEM69526.1 SH3 domain-containing protein [Loktanella fryxellensis]